MNLSVDSNERFAADAVFDRMKKNPENVLDDWKKLDAW